MRDFLKERYDWCKSVKRLPLVHEGSCGQVVVVMLWPATNHTEFKLYAFSFNTHHAPETAAARSRCSSSVTLLRIGFVVELGG